MKKIAVCLLWLISPMVFAGSLHLNISGESFEAQYMAASSSNSINLSGGALLTDDNGDVFNLGIHTHSDMRALDNVTGGLGARLYYIDGNGDDAQALGIGGHLNIGIATDFSLAARIYVAPSVVTSSEIDGLTEFSFGIQFDLFTEASLFAGIRNVELEFDGGGDFEIDDSSHFGIILRF